jgi:hypothetical protein
MKRDGFNNGANDKEGIDGHILKSKMGDGNYEAGDDTTVFEDR